MVVSRETDQKLSGVWITVSRETGEYVSAGILCLRLFLDFIIWRG